MGNNPITYRGYAKQSDEVFLNARTKAVEFPVSTIDSPCACCVAHAYNRSCFAAGVVEEMRCFSCSNVEVQMDQQTGLRHTDRCDFYNEENAVCESGQVSERIAKLRSALLRCISYWKRKRVTLDANAQFWVILQLSVSMFNVGLIDIMSYPFLVLVIRR